MGRVRGGKSCSEKEGSEPQRIDCCRLLHGVDVVGAAEDLVESVCGGCNARGQSSSVVDAEIKL